MSSHSTVEAAARNNAEWCHAFCGAHGVVGRFGPGFWASSVRTPVLYPDAVTLDAEVSTALLLSSIDTSEGCGVKDSFVSLGLDAQGFRPLFHADWIAREPPAAEVAGPSWSVVTTEAGLHEWEACWGEAPGGSAFFPPALLDDETIAVLARSDGDRIVAGGIANRSATVVGLGNVFDVGGDLEAAWRDGAAAAARLWSPAPVVGYDSGASLEAARRAGFATVGELVVWVS